ncbi:MAG: GntR family transcriptional regulator [Bacteroidales bacterium]|jgi:GntR family transcriptional regulator|nr:GntR family transcriptional regulator [Bacteroidales bacterium]
MDFRETQAIYLQIVEWICEQIILEVWHSGDKIPSVRELAVELEVNPNTIARTYEQLQSMDLVVNKRGIGLFVADHSKDKATKYLKKQFIEKNLPQMFNYIKLLDISMEELNELYHTFTNKQQKR